MPQKPYMYCLIISKFRTDKMSKTKFTVSEQELKRIRKEIEVFKRRQRKQQSGYTKLYISTDTVLDIYTIIESIQKVPPYKPVERKDVVAKNPELDYRMIGRALELLCKLKVLECFERGQYWLPEYREKSLELAKKRLDIEQKAREYAEKEVEVLKQQKKELLDKNKSLSKEKRYFAGAYNMGKPYLDALIYCDSDEDWALLEAFFVKMRENKLEKELAEEWKQEQEEHARIMEEIEREKLSL